MTLWRHMEMGVCKHHEKRRKNSVFADTINLCLTVYYWNVSQCTINWSKNTLMEYFQIYNILTGVELCAVCKDSYVILACVFLPKRKMIGILWIM